MKRIYVGNLPATVSDQELQNLFTSYGSVKTAHVIKDKLSGESRGFGFVEMSEDMDGENAITGLNGFEVQGQRLRVSEARPRREFGNGGGERRFGSGGGYRRDGGRGGDQRGGDRRGGYGSDRGFGRSSDGGSRF